MVWCKICGSLITKKNANGKLECDNSSCGKPSTTPVTNSVAANNGYATIISKIEEKIEKHKPIYSDEIFKLKELLVDADLHERAKINLEKIIHSGEYVSAICFAGGKHAYIYAEDPAIKEGPQAYSLSEFYKNVVCNKQSNCSQLKKYGNHCTFHAAGKDVKLAKQIIKSKHAGILLS